MNQVRARLKSQVSAACYIPDVVLAQHCWPGLAGIGRVDRTRVCKRTGATTAESQLYLLGRAYTPERLLALSRGHWAEVVKVPPGKAGGIRPEGVENNLHWVLDVTMGEDAADRGGGVGHDEHSACNPPHA